MSLAKKDFRPGDRVYIRPAGRATLIAMVYTYPDTPHSIWTVAPDEPWPGGGALLDGDPVWSDERFTLIGRFDPDFCGPV